MMTFKDYLIEYHDPEMTPQDRIRQQREYKTNPKVAHRKQAQKQRAEADMAKKDPNASTEQKNIERQEAIAAQKRAQFELRKKKEEQGMQ